MFDFDYYNPTRIVFGRNRLNELDALVPASATVLITSGGGSAKRSGLVDKVRSALGSRKVFEFEGIEPNPHFETAMRAVEVVKRERIDFLLAVGGGSVIDGTKFIALASRCAGDAAELLNYGLMPIPREVSNSAVPIGTVFNVARHWFRDEFWSRDFVRTLEAAGHEWTRISAVFDTRPFAHLHAAEAAGRQRNCRRLRPYDGTVHHLPGGRAAAGSDR